MGDDSQAIVFEFPEAIRTALDQLHLAVESFGDPVVAREAPHAGDRFDPVVEGVGERLQGSRLILPQVADGCQQPADVSLALFLALELVVHEFAQLVHFFVERLEDRVGGEELFQPRPLLLIELLRSLAQGGEVAPVVLEVSATRRRASRMK